MCGPKYMVAVELWK
uniref:Uncharacterized protein n=1 Tax=Arundo donax TaxID=35708 RepID=A0A0A9C1G3_ARUDO